MKVIQHCYSAETNLIDLIAEGMNGVIDGNFIKGDNEVYSGTHFVLTMEDSISAMMVDVLYKENVLLKYKNDKDSFVGLYFYITNYNFNFIVDDEASVVGRYDYNLAILDSVLETEYFINGGTSTYTICIFLDKLKLKEYMEKIPRLKLVSKDVFNAEKNTIISMGRMSTESSILLKEFRKISYDSFLFELYFRGLIYSLIGDYLDKLLEKKIIISKVIGDDIKSILESKALLMKSIEGIFPGIEILAEKVHMSPSKYKKLFTKITGLSPGNFFSDSKLEHAKELLETGQYTVSEVSDKLNYANISYFAKRFSSKYGIFPKEYQSQL